MPDQSLDQQTSPTTAAEPTTTPDDTSANHPEAATQESVESNVTRISDGEKQQADVTINRDPVIRSGGDYSELNLEELREELGNRNLSKSGNKPDLIARLQQADAKQAKADGGNDSADADAATRLGAPVTDAEIEEDRPTAGVNPTDVENGGIQRTEVAVEHAEILQSLSAERRKQQLSAARTSRRPDAEDEQEQQDEQQGAQPVATA